MECSVIGTRLVLILCWLTLAGSKTDFCLQPLGMQNTVISKSQISGKGSKDGYLPYNGRLYHRYSWCASPYAYEPHLQVDLGRIMGIRKFATQGDGWLNYVTHYRMEYSYDGVTFRKVIDEINGNAKEFVGNNDGSRVKTHQFEHFRFSGRHIRIVPVYYISSDRCMRVELYGCPIVCNRGLGFESTETLPLGAVISSSTSQNENEPSKVRLMGSSAWCSFTQDAHQYLHIDLGKLMSVAGIATQGNPSTDNWVKTFQVQFGETFQTLATVQKDGSEKIFVGNTDRNSVVMNWFTSTLEAVHVVIRPKTWQGAICMRIELVGCQEEQISPLGVAYKVINDSSLTVSSVLGNNPQRSATMGRLNSPYSWCGHGEGKQHMGKEWLAVDVGRVMLLSGLSMQGDPTYGPNYFRKVYIEYSFDGGQWFFINEEKSNEIRVFPGVYNSIATEFQIFEGISARHIRFRGDMMNDKYHQCLRVEIYGRPLHCTESLGVKMGFKVPNGFSLSTFNGILPANTARLRSKAPWCAKETEQFLQIDLGSFMIVNGLALQARPFHSSPNQFTIEYGKEGKLSPIREGSSSKLFQFISNWDTVIRVWFPEAVRARIIRFIPASFDRELCLRIDLLGCKEECNLMLGLASKQIPENDITASSLSSLIKSSYSRLNYPGQAWMPHLVNKTQPGASVNETATKEWIQACLTNMTTITGLLFQGGGNMTFDRVQTFSLAYSYDANGTFYEYHEASNNTIFSVNISRYSTLQVKLPIPVVARCLRLKVESFSGRNAALRWELIGCNRGSAPELSIEREIVVSKGNAMTMSCQARGQPGIKFEWFIGETPISPMAAYNHTTILSDGSLLGLTKSQLSIIALPKDLGVKHENCSHIDGNSSILNCSTVVKCAAFYKYTQLRREISSTLWITEVNAKASKPQELICTQSDPMDFQVTWSDPKDPSDLPFKYYRIQLFYNGVKIQDSTTFSNFHRWTNLAPFSNYSVSVTSVNTMDIESSTLHTFLFTGEGVATAPREITVLSASATSIKVTWKKPDPPNGVITKYNIRAWLNGTDTVNYSVEADISSATLQNLHPFKNYSVQVQALNKRGALEGEWSEAIYCLTRQGHPSTPRFINSNILSSQEVKLDWHPPADMKGILQYYKVKVVGTKSYNKSFLDQKELKSTTPNIYIQVFGGSAYSITISAVNGENEGKKASIAIETPHGGLTAPTSLTIQGPHGTQIFLHISPDLNGPVSHYKIIALRVENCSLSPSKYVIVDAADLNWKTESYEIQIVRGDEQLKGVALVLPLVGMFTFCFNAIFKTENQTIYGDFDMFSIERRSLPKPVRNDEPDTTETTIKMELVEGKSQNITYYQIVVVELANNSDTVNVNPNDFPPSTLLPCNSTYQPVGVPYIAGEFPASKFQEFKTFVVGDGKLYTREVRPKRDLDQPPSYHNVPLKLGSSYAVFQRAVETEKTFYTGPWIGPVKMKPFPTLWKAETLKMVIIPTDLGVVFVALLAFGTFIVIYLIRRHRKKQKRKRMYLHRRAADENGTSSRTRTLITRNEVEANQYDVKKEIEWYVGGTLQTTESNVSQEKTNLKQRSNSLEETKARKVYTSHVLRCYVSKDEEDKEESS